MKRINLFNKRKNSRFKRLVPFFLVLVILTCLIIFLTTLSGSSSVINFIFSNIGLKSNDDRVNILLLGMAGGRHDGATLTDTIMVASYNLKTQQLTLISIPRDLWLPDLRAKANAVYQIGLSQGNGLDFSKTVIGNIFGLPIHYGLRIDFGGFVKAVDALGGIDVVVENSFDDYIFPIPDKEDDLCGYTEKEMDFSEEDARKLNINPGKQKVFIAPDGAIATDSAQENKGIKYFSCRYEHISFDSGLVHMDGKTALKFVRSRHGTNGEGSDFARSKRQEKVLEAFRKKLLSFETFSSADKISELKKTFDKSIDTDMSAKDALEFYKLSKKLDSLVNLVLDDSLLTHPPASDYGGAYVLVSQDDDFSLIQSYVRKVLSGEINESTDSSRSRDK